jgi:hypothetical protein
MLSDYRIWLESELKLLGNASHHAYSFGQANMAKRAMERLDHEVGDRVLVTFSLPEASGILTALEMLLEKTSALPPELAGLRERISVAVNDVHGLERVKASDLPERLDEAPEGTA